MKQWYTKHAVRIFAALLAQTLLLSCALVGCGPESGAPQSVKSEAKGIVIGFSMATIQEERWTKDRDIFVARAKQAGMDVIVQNADNDPDMQKKQIEYLIRQGVDVLVIIPQLATNLSQSTEMARRAGIPVISYDRLILNGKADVYISFDNEAVGNKMAAAAIERVPKGDYLLIHGSPDDHNSEMFKKGYMDVLQPYIDRGDIHIVGEKAAKDWRREEAYSFVQETIQKGQHLDAIICANDALASGAVQALAEYQLAGQVLVTGHDADLSACQRIVEGTQAITIYKPIKMIAQKAADVAIQLVRHQKIESNDTISDGTYTIPYIKLDVVVVDKNNMDEVIIKDGFHLKEDVYQNTRSAIGQ